MNWKRNMECENGLTDDGFRKDFKREHRPLCRTGR
jgi:hypothetical protein